MTYKDNVKCALDVIAGKYGNHEARRQALTQAVHPQQSDLSEILIISLSSFR
mgnify:CR=1 FL=1